MLLTWERPCRAPVLSVAAATAGILFFYSHFWYRNKEQQQQQNHSFRVNTVPRPWTSFFSATPRLIPRVLGQAKGFLLFLHLILPIYSGKAKPPFSPGLPLPSPSSFFRASLRGNNLYCLHVSGLHLQRENFTQWLTGSETILLGSHTDPGWTTD